ncbi:MAG: hypothetical protein WD895_09855 [Acidimicrobiia bacterium]
MVNEVPDPFEVLRQTADTSDPSQEDIRRARDRLQAAIANARRRPEHRSRRIVVAIAAAAALIILVGIGLVRPSPAEAALSEIAEAARTATPTEIPEGAFLYTRSERVELAIRPGAEFGSDREYVAFLLPSVREVWRNHEARFIQLRTTNGSPRFFDPDDEAAYYELGLDEVDQVGQARTEQFTNAIDPIQEEEWPTEADTLYAALLDYSSQGGDERPAPARVFALATSLLREADPPPELRVAVLEVLAALPVDLVGKNDGGVTIGLDYEDPFPTRDTITLNEKGDLLGETSTLLDADTDLGLPAGTTVLETMYDVTSIRDDL